MTNWLERAKREFSAEVDQPTAKTAETTLMAVMAVPQLDGVKSWSLSNVSIGSTSDGHFQNLEAKASTLAKLEAAVNRYCDAVGDNAERRMCMLDDCREFPADRWPWLIGFLTEQAASIERGLTGDDDDRRRCTDCRNLAENDLCLAAWRGELTSGLIARRYHPARPKQLRRCEAYAPRPDDPDQRPGSERWPGLLSKREDTDD